MEIKDILEGHAVYNKYVKYWDFLLQSYEGGFDYTGAVISGGQNKTDGPFQITVNGQKITASVKGNLFMHPKERMDDYAQRVAMSYYYNFCAPIVDIYVNHLFKQPPVDDFGNIKSDIEEISEDIDVMGSSIPEFRRNLSTMCQVYGHMFVVVDSPLLPSGAIQSRQDQIENRAFPYLTMYPPQSLVNWALDRFGNPYWIILKESEEVNTDPFNFNAKESKKSLYRLWTREEWVLFDEKGNEIGRGAHGLGIVPVVCAFDKRSHYALNFLGISSLADIAFIARDIYNSCSELKQILRDQTFAFLALQGSSDEYDEVEVGTNKGLLYGEGRNVPQYVSPPSDNAQVYFQHIDRQVSKIYQLAKLEGGSAEFKGQNAVEQSGVSKAWDFNETNSSLTSKSNNLEDAEMKIWRIFGLWLGKDFDGKVAYPKEFSVSKISDDMNEAEQSARLSLGNTFQLEVLKAIQKKKFPSATEEELTKMADEAETSLNNANSAGLSIRDRFPGLFKQHVNSTAKGG